MVANELEVLQISQEIFYIRIKKLGEYMIIVCPLLSFWIFFFSPTLLSARQKPYSTCP